MSRKKTTEFTGGYTEDTAFLLRGCIKTPTGDVIWGTPRAANRYQALNQGASHEIEIELDALDKLLETRVCALTDLGEEG